VKNSVKFYDKRAGTCGQCDVKEYGVEQTVWNALLWQPSCTVPAYCFTALWHVSFTGTLARQAVLMTACLDILRQSSLFPFLKQLNPDGRFQEILWSGDIAGILSYPCSQSKGLRGNKYQWQPPCLLVPTLFSILGELILAWLVWAFWELDKQSQRGASAWQLATQPVANTVHSECHCAFIQCVGSDVHEQRCSKNWIKQLHTSPIFNGNFDTDNQIYVP
jgi:hypothetical protein